MNVLSRMALLGLVCSGALFFTLHPVVAQEKHVPIEKVEVALSQQGPVLLLHAQEKKIPIFVDPTVAGSVHAALQGLKFERPLSHDLMHSILEAYQGEVLKTEITLKDGTFLGALTVKVQGTEKVFDSRSSDSIALAVHFKAPIYVTADALESAGKTDIVEEIVPTETL